MKCDCMHSAIEKNTEGNKVHHPDGWLPIITGACKKHYRVKKMEHTPGIYTINMRQCESLYIWFMSEQTV